MLGQIPLYYVKIIKLDGTAIAAPLEVAGVSFTQAVYVASQDNPDIGSCVITLCDVRDVRWQYLLPTYRLLDYEQRIEIYTDAALQTTPVWTGVITRLPQDLDGAPTVIGAGILRRLATRKLRRTHAVNDTATNVISDLLKTYQVVFKDDFTSNTIGTNWEYTRTGTGWSITGGVLKNYANAVGDGGLRTITTYTQAQWQDSKISFDFYFDNPSLSYQSDYGLNLTLQLKPSDTTVAFIVTGYMGASTDEFVDIYDDTFGTRPDRRVPVEKNTWNHLDIYNIPISSTVMRSIIVLNGTEVVDLSDVTFTAGTTKLLFLRAWGGGTFGIWYDNFVFAVKSSTLTAGTIDSTVTTIDETFNADSHREALDFVADYMGWDYRVRARAGAGNDLFDCGASVGTDYSTTTTLEEGKQLTELNVDRASDELATSIHVYSQSQDDLTLNFISNKLDAFDTYGIIEADYSNPIIRDSATAKIIGDNRLAVVSGGQVSLSGTLLDEPSLFSTPLQAGDYVWLKSPTCNVNRKVRVVQIARKSGDPTIALTFDYFAFKQSARQLDYEKRLRRALHDLMQRLNSLGPFTFTGVVSSPRQDSPSFRLRGQLASVQVDVKVVSLAGGSIYFFIDGTDRTIELLGASQTTDFSVYDTTYLTVAGFHTIGFTSGGTGANLSVTVTGRLLG